MNALTKRFFSILDDPSAKEPDLQNFFERCSEFLPTPFLHGHGVHFHSFLSKVQVDTHLITDFVYVTKQSSRWDVVLIEIERPNKMIFKDDPKFTSFSAEFNDALAQVKTWRDYLRKHPDSLLRRLRPFMQPHAMLSNPIGFKYVLIYGRRSEFEGNEKRTQRFDGESNSEIAVVTYDSCVTAMQHHAKRRMNLLRMEGDRFTFKYLSRLPESIFAWMHPHELFVSDAHRSILDECKYDIDSWEQGKLLQSNGMSPDIDLSGPNFNTARQIFDAKFANCDPFSVLPL